MNIEMEWEDWKVRKRKKRWKLEREIKSKSSCSLEKKIKKKKRTLMKLRQRKNGKDLINFEWMGKSGKREARRKTCLILKYGR